MSHETTFKLGTMKVLGQSLLAHVLSRDATRPDKGGFWMWGLGLGRLEDIEHDRKHRQAVFA